MKLFVVADIELLEDCCTLFSKEYMVTILEYFDHPYILVIGCAGILD